MAWSTTVTARGSATEQVSDTNISVNPTATLVVNKVVFVMCVTDNDSVAVSDGPSNRHTSVADSKNNQWRKIAEYTDSDGSAADGTTISVWGARITTQILTTDSITLTVASAVTIKIISVLETTPVAGNTFTVEQIAIGQGTLSTTTSGLTNTEHLFLYCAGAEGTDATKTPPTNFTERFDLLVGTLTAEMCYRIVTNTGQAAASTSWTNTNPMALQIALKETTGSPSISPSASISPSISPSVSSSISPSISPSVPPIPTIRFYILPIEVVGNARGPKYFKWRFNEAGIDCRWSMKDYGLIPAALIAAEIISEQHDSLVLNVDVAAAPIDIDQLIDTAQVPTVKNVLEQLRIPADWVDTTYTYRQILRMIAGLFMFAQRHHGLHNEPLIDNVSQLDLLWNQIPLERRIRIQTTADNLGYIYSEVQATWLVRRILKYLGDQWSSKAILFGFTVL